MSAKWRAIQHRHRYTYNSVIFPKSFIEALNLVSAEASSWPSDFLSQLKILISLNSTYSQLVAVKDLSSAFAQLLAFPSVADDTLAKTTRLYLEILFLDNSLPLHRTLISALVKTQKISSIIGQCLLSLCEEYSDAGNRGKKRFLVARAVLSLISYPKLAFLNEIVEKCSGFVATDIVAGLGSVVLDVRHGCCPSPMVMEQCQDSMSCLYYLLQRYPNIFVGSEDSYVIFKSVVEAILSVLKSPVFSRDCLVAAGVSFCAAIQAFMSSEEVCNFISREFFGLFSEGSGTGNLVMEKLFHYENWSLRNQEFSVLARLCLLRGMLTAIPRNVLNMHLTQLTNGSFWTILYDGILPELCKYCENPIDSHFNFHALTVTQICLQQAKTSLLTGLTASCGDYSAFSEDTMYRILRIIWNNLEDPLSQTVKQVHLIFDLLLDIESYMSLGVGNSGKKLFLHKIAGDLLCLGPHCKGRYVPLASLTKRLGAKTLLDLNQKLLLETTYAYVDDDVCCAATSFLKFFLECLRDECWSNHGIERGYDVFRDLCLPPVLHGLVSGHVKLRSNLNTYALPTVLEVDTDSIFSMLGFISIGPSIKESINVDLKIEQCVAALVSLLKVTRMLALIEGDIDLESHNTQKDNFESSDLVALLCIKGITVRVPAFWFTLALKHADDNLRIDAAESLFLSPKTSTVPSAFELSLMRTVVPLNMRCSSTAFQMKWTSLFRKFFARVHTALERLVKQGFWKPDACYDRKKVAFQDPARDLVISRADVLFYFMKWLSSFLFHSCYPSAPYERKTMAMQLILVMIDAWPIVIPQGIHHLYPYNEVVISPDATLALVGSVIDSWDKLRESSFRILLFFPTPLPGISSIDSVNVLIHWAKKLVCSPRVRESDAGALSFRLIFKKYVLGLGWELGVSEEASCLTPQRNGYLYYKSSNPSIKYLSSLIEWLCIVVEEGEKDLSEACKKSFVHGVLLTLRYTFEELDWSSSMVQSSITEFRCLLEMLLDLIMRITSLALWVVSADAWSMPYDIDDTIDESAFLSDLSFGVAAPESVSDQGDNIFASEDNVRPAQQVVMVGCWLAMKEISLLLGTIIRKIPLPSCTLLDSSEHADAAGRSNEVDMSNLTDGLLDLVQLETIGNHFLQVLLKMKHNGAIDKTRAGFTALCNRLLCSNDSRLNKMTESWMEQLMERTTAKGQTVDDLLRRSAGIPAAFIAFFLSEPEGTPKKLLPRALRWLIDIANKSLSNSSEFGCNKKETISMEKPSRSADDSELEGLTTISANTKKSQIINESVVPTVHALNVLRAAFNDTNLSADTSGFCAEAMIVSIRSFLSPYWEVRNSACLAYTSLIRRMLGFFNIQKRESQRRALTGHEFFHRYPALHSFLLSELKIATDLLEDGCSSYLESNIAKAIHPSLCPILILLSRLKPSATNSGADDALDPSLFIPFIQRCATQSNLRVRVLASRALTGLVSVEKLQTVIRSVGHDLPRERCQLAIPSEEASLSLYQSVTVSNGFGNASTCTISFNSIHGLLLQLSSLLDNNCRDLPDLPMKEEILGELIDVLFHCNWIGRTRSCSCPILNSSYIHVLDLMLDISKSYTSQHTPRIRFLLLQLSLECLDEHKKPLLAWYDPTIVELRRQATLSYFNCLMGRNYAVPEACSQLLNMSSPDKPTKEVLDVGPSVSELQQIILSSIRDPTYEVQLAALKKLLQLVNSLTLSCQSGVLHLWARSNLHSVLIKLLFLEENPKCTYYVLKIFFNWNTQQLEKPTDLQCSIAADCDFLFRLWDRLVSIYETVKHIKTREITLCCMGVCIKQFVHLLNSSLFTGEYQIIEEPANDTSEGNQSAKWIGALRCIDFFVTLVNSHSSPSEPVNLRKAAAEAIVASGLLSELMPIALIVSNDHATFEETDISIKKIFECHMPEAVSLYACKILHLWFSCIQLLEDEDNELRQKLAKDVQNCIATDRSSNTDAVPTQVDRVIELSFNFLSSACSHWFEYMKYLANWVLRTGSSVSSYGDLVRQVFDKEIDNHHEEKLLICQLCCLHLGNLLASNSSEVQVNHQGLSYSCIQKFSSVMRLNFLRQLISLSKSFLETEGITDWIGGIGNHKNAFVCVYANLLGIYALSQPPHELNKLGCPADINKLYLLEFGELEQVIRPFLRNPLISNLYEMVMALHLRMLGVSQTGYKSDGFDPYFLLR